MTHEPLQPFAGFPPGKTETVLIPVPFFNQLLPIVDDLAELKVSAYCFWAIQQREGDFRYIRYSDMCEDRLLLAGFSADPGEAVRVLDQALARATRRGTLLHIVVRIGDADERLYFINTERGRRAIAALERGDWQPGPDDLPVLLVPPRPNIFVLYEQNIGALTPMIAEILKDAERTYPQPWIEESIQIAVERNIRSWRYVESILKRWLAEGKSDGRSVQANAGKDRGAAGAYGDYERFWDSE